MSQLPSTPSLSTPEPITLPLDIILYMAKFLSFIDYRSFIQSIWPNNDECDIVRARLWKLSTHKITIRFINGEPLEIEYNYDPWRTEEVFINSDCLLPVFGEADASAMDKFTSVSKLTNFVETHVNLDMCSDDRRYASCPCRSTNVDRQSAGAFVKPSVTTCEFGHFHHYCSQHINYWLNFILEPSIMRLEAGESFDEDIVTNLLLLLDNTIYFLRTEVQLRDSSHFIVL
ncbi:d5.1 [Tranosema rostrale ichnovirus]|nr:d5.1 [Tranosema rostrale ichnovirus]